MLREEEKVPVATSRQMLHWKLLMVPLSTALLTRDWKPGESSDRGLDRQASFAA
jgi:hypothetical protein